MEGAAMSATRKRPESATGRRPKDAAPRTMRWYLGRLSLADARRLQTLRSTRDVELHRLTLGERLETLALNRGEVNEHVFATLLRDETETLRLVEPLHGATSHCDAP